MIYHFSSPKCPCQIVLMMSWKILECPISTQSHRNELDPILLSRNRCPIATVFFHVPNYKDIHPQCPSTQLKAPTKKRVKLYCYCVSLDQFLQLHQSGQHCDPMAIWVFSKGHKRYVNILLSFIVQTPFHSQCLVQQE